MSLSGNLPAHATSWLETGLLPNISYGPLFVQAFNAGGTGNSNPASRYTLAAVPQSVTVTALSTNTISVSWSANGNPASTSYDILRSSAGTGVVALTGGSGLSPVSVVGGTAFLDAGLFPSLAYFYKVRAVNSEQIPTDYSPMVSTKTLALPVSQAAATLDSVRVYPNPYRPNGGNPDQGRPFSAGDPNSGIVFDNLTPSVNIKVYNVTGQLVVELGSDNSGGRLQWDARNGNGRDVASGNYNAVLTAAGQTSIVKRIMIIR
jgi:hypothetical protein